MVKEDHCDPNEPAYGYAELLSCIQSLMERCDYAEEERGYIEEEIEYLEESLTGSDYTPGEKKENKKGLKKKKDELASYDKSLKLWEDLIAIGMKELRQGFWDLTPYRANPKISKIRKLILDLDDDTFYDLLDCGHISL